VTELETRLTELGGALDWPRTPALADTVTARVAGAPPERHRLWPRRRALAVGFAVALAGTGAAAAAGVNPLDLFTAHGVRVQRAPGLPRTVPGAALDLGRRVTLDEARLGTAFTPLVPPLGAPDAVYLRQDIPGGAVSLLYRPRAGIPPTPDPRIGLLLTEFHGSFKPFIEKTIDTNARVEQTTVGGEPALWIEGDHTVLFADARGQVREDRRRLATNSLIWQRGPLTLRLEGRLTKASALRIAGSVTAASASSP
jgi:hypothetical protein